MNNLIPSQTRFLERVQEFLDRLEPLLPPASKTPDWKSAVAFRWRKRAGVGFLQPVKRLPNIKLQDLHDIDDQKERLEANTKQFLAKKPANNVLLTGTRGSGKSSLIKALLNKYARKGLRVIEVEKDELIDLPEIVDLIGERPERFIIFCDDLSFSSGEGTYKALKVILDGSLESPPENVLIYATSNRRHLMPEYFSENMENQRIGDEIHPGEAVEEKISLSERFGLWLSFYPFDQEAYLRIVSYWLKTFGYTSSMNDDLEREAVNWALQRGSRSGRIALQFAKDWAGRYRLLDDPERSK